MNKKQYEFRRNIYAGLKTFDQDKRFNKRPFTVHRYLTLILWFCLAGKKGYKTKQFTLEDLDDILEAVRYIERHLKKGN